MPSFPELDDFIDRLRQTGHRVTMERMHLFREVYNQHGHLDAEALLEALKAKGRKISRATLYRNLELLAELGFVRKHRLGGNRYLYEHVHPGQRHDHIVCGRCGRVAEFVSPAIVAMQREIARAHGFDPEVHTLQIHSQCLDCGDG
ncbi:MAG: transcriptional repressor [Acidobacteria bacterium]|nr:MAG: transcriptional repressor [Acidobacteriota bacterium]